MANPAINFAGFLYDDAGDAISGATVNLYDKNTSTTSRASTTTDSNGAWSIAHTTAGEFDVQITSGSSKRRIKFDDKVHLSELDAETINVRGNEGAAAPLYFFSDEGDDAGDRWLFNAAAGGVFTMGNDIQSQGTYVAHVTITPNATVANSTFAIAGNLDVDGTANLDAVDIDGAVQLDSTFTVGVDDTGYDVKFFGASSGAYFIYDQSEDQVEIRGAAADATTSTGKLLLSTALTNINANDVIGKISFQAPLEAGGTDAITVAASIEAVAQGTFSASVNATDLIFKTGHSEAATEKFRFTSQGEIGIGGANYGSSGDVLTSGGAGSAPSWATPTTGDITGVTAGDGLSGGGTSGGVTLALDLNELTGATLADGDSLVFIDANDSNGSRKEAFADVLDTIAGTVATTGLDRSGATLVLSDLHPVGVSGSNNQLITDDGDGTVTSESNLTFDGSVLTVTGSVDTTLDQHFDSSPSDETVSGITATFTAGEALERGEVVYFKAGDSKMWKAVATAAGTMPVAAMAAADISADATGKFLLYGFLADNGTFPAYTVGGDLYAPEAETSSQNVPEQTAPDSDGDFVQVLGYAVTANSVFFNPDQTIVEVA